MSEELDYDSFTKLSILVTNQRKTIESLKKEVQNLFNLLKRILVLLSLDMQHHLNADMLK